VWWHRRGGERVDQGPVTSSTPSRRWFAIAVAAIVMFAGAGSAAYWIFTQGGSHTTTPDSVGNGYTFGQAYAEVNWSLSNLSGGPWSPTSIVGIAPQEPVAPLPNYGASLNVTMRNCGLVPGVTIWNASGILVFTGTLNSGAATFWSMLFKNSSNSHAYATFLAGVVHVDPPSPTLENCVRAAGIGSNDTLDPKVDTPGVAQSAYTIAGSAFSEKHSPLVQYYVLGDAQVLEPDASPLGWVVNYFRCDLTGVTGLQNYTAVGLSGTSDQTFIDNGWLTCTLPNYHLAFASGSTDSSGGVSYVSLPFQVTASGILKDNTTLYDGWGLLSWMFDLKVLDSSNATLPAAAASCQSWVPDLTDCGGNSSGWFAVLLSQNGAWLDSFPSTAGGSSWAVPNVIVSSQDELVVVCPSSWSLGADTLVGGGNPSSLDISGSTTL
jgi:hypothetical protein